MCSAVQSSIQLAWKRWRQGKADDTGFLANSALLRLSRQIGHKLSGWRVVEGSGSIGYTCITGNMLRLIFGPVLTASYPREAKKNSYISIYGKNVLSSHVSYRGRLSLVGRTGSVNSPAVSEKYFCGLGFVCKRLNGQVFYQMSMQLLGQICWMRSSFSLAFSFPFLAASWNQYFAESQSSKPKLPCKNMSPILYWALEFPSADAS